MTAATRGIERLSLNQITTKGWTLAEAVRGCADAGVPAIGLWRDKVAEAGGPARAATLVRAAGLTVSSLCRGGFLTAPTGTAARTVALDDNRRAVEEAAALGTDTLVLVCGGLPEGEAGRDLAGARDRVRDALAELAPFAGAHGVRLAVEPLHPMFCADRAVVSTLGQALDLAEPFPVDQVGVVVDSYHVWWDPELYAQIARAGARIAAYQVCDWTLPLPADALLGRGHVGDGVIDFPPLSRAVAAAGYTGWIEVELFNQEVWDTPGEQTLRRMIDRHLAHVVLPPSTAES